MDLHAPGQPVHVPAGTDRFGEDQLMIWGLIPLAVKVSSRDTGGALYVFQHPEMKRGFGPPAHVHHEQDEWFFVIDGEFAIEVGGTRFRLKGGDSFLAPRKVPHAWVCASYTGSLMTAVTPAGTFETFLHDTTRHATLPTPEEVAKAFAAHGMTVVGPPLKLD